MTTGRCVHLWFTLSVFCLIGSPAAGSTIDIIATADGSWSPVLGFSETTPVLLLENAPGPGGTSVAMIEFDLVGLGGATVESATFLGTVLSAGHSFPPSSPSIVLLLSGYTGDGVVEFSDLLAPRSFVGMSGQLPSVAPPQTLEVAVPLDVSFAQGLLGGYLGLWAQTSSSGIFTSMDLASLENTLGVPPPTLRLVTSETLPPTPVAEPSTVLLVAGGLAAVARLRCRTNARRAA